MVGMVEVCDSVPEIADGQSLREWRIRHQYTVRALANRLGVDESTVRRWERGERSWQGHLLALSLWALEQLSQLDFSG